MTLPVPVSTSVTQQAEHDRQHNVRCATMLRLSRMETVADNAEGKSASTLKQYQHSQKKWRDWCEERGWTDGLLVTEDKALLFLKEIIVFKAEPLPPATATSAAPGENSISHPVTATEPAVGRAEIIDGSLMKVSCQTAACVVSAIVDLWQTQTLHGFNNHPTPRGPTVRGFLQRLKKAEVTRKRANFDDNQTDTIEAKYSDSNFQAFNLHCLKSSGVEEVQMRAMWLVSSAMVSRGDNIRSAELSDLFSVATPGSAQGHQCIMLLKERSKTNTNGELEYAGMLRHRDILRCPVQALAFYFFTRFHLQLQGLPDFSQRRKWHTIPTFIDDKTGKAMLYDKHYRQIKRIQAKLHIKSKKSTHQGRGPGVQVGETAGLDLDDLRRAGRWCADRMTRHYLQKVSTKVLLTAAGFDKESEYTSYHLNRATLSPPASILALIFPEADDWLHKVEHAVGDHGPIQQDMSAQGFLRMLIYLRTVIVQDLAVLANEYPSHIVLKHAMFQHPDFIKYRQEMVHHLETATEPIGEQLEASHPMVADALKRMTDTFDARLKRIEAKTDENTAQLASLEAKTDKNTAQLASLKRSRLHVSLSIYPFGDGSGPGQVEVQRTSQQGNTVLTEVEPPLPRLAGSMATSAVAGVAVFEVNTQDLPPSTPLPLLPPTVPQYEMHKLKTIVLIWREYEDGVYGGPSVKSLDEHWGGAWRRQEKTKKMHQRRSQVYALVKTKAIEWRIPCAQAAQRLEEQRLALNKPLKWIIDNHGAM